MSVRTIKMFEKGTNVDFHLTMNPRLRQERPFRGTVVNYPPGQYTQKILTKNRDLVEAPVILIKIKTAKIGEFTVDARCVKSVKATEKDLQMLQDSFGR